MMQHPLTCTGHLLDMSLEFPEEGEGVLVRQSVKNLQP